MASPRGSLSSCRAGPDRHISKPVMPVLPLPYAKRQAAAASRSWPPPPPTVPSHAAEAAQKTSERQKCSLGVPNDDGLHPVPEQYSTCTDADAEASETGLLSVSSTTLKSGTASTEHTGVQELAADDSVPQTHPAGFVDSVRVLKGATANSVLRHVPIECFPAEALHTRLPPAISPTRFQMPPPFQHSHHPPAATENGGMAHGPPPHLPNGPNPMHQAHPSNGSIHFGTFHDSQSSSPIPPHSGSTMPPPGMADPDSRPAHIAHATNGFPPAMPFGSDVNFDGFGRPRMRFAHVDLFPPYGINYGPSTTRSFHSSQSSARAELPPGTTRNGGVVLGDDMHSQNSQRRMLSHPNHQMMPPNLGFTHLMHSADYADGLIDYTQQLFDCPELADCTLELRYPDDRAPPVRVTGHRLILCRSAVLSARIHETIVAAGSPKDGLHTVILENDSRWMRSEAFYMAVQRLYGLPLLPMPLQNGADSADAIEVELAKEQFEFCLSYAAAGRLIGWTPVARRGCEAATQLLGWPMLEKGLEFALDGYCDKVSHEFYKHGDGSRTILDAVATYVAHGLSPGFCLDTSVGEPEGYARLPIYAASSPIKSSALPKPKISASTGVSSLQLGKGRRPQRIANIQFGDLAVPDAVDASEPETPNGTQQAQSMPRTILSRVLLNLPFPYLKMLLELPGPAMPNDWTSIDIRACIVKRVVEEREARRLRAFEAVTSGRVVVPNAVRAALRNPNPQDIGRWSALCWQEEMLAYGNHEVPSLARKWVPLMELQNGPVNEYP